MLHIILHFIVPLLVAKLFFNKNWQKAYLIMVATMIVDADHLFAVPIYDATRCSIGFHPLHTFIPIILYLLAIIHPKTRLIGIGLLIHMVLDSIDCQITNGVWINNFN